MPKPPQLSRGSSPEAVGLPEPLGIPPGDAPPAAGQEDARRARERFDLLLSCEYITSQLSAEFSAAQLGDYKGVHLPVHHEHHRQHHMTVGEKAGLEHPTPLAVNKTWLANGDAGEVEQQQPSADAARDAPPPADDRAQVSESPGLQAEVSERSQAGAPKERKTKRPNDSLQGCKASPSSRASEETRPAGQPARPPAELSRKVPKPSLKALIGGMGGSSAKAIRGEMVHTADSVLHMIHLDSSMPRMRVRDLLNSSWFDTVMGVLIFANSVEIGLESSYRLQGVEVPAFAVLEWIFLITYIVELGLRIFAFGSRCFHSGWVQFDAMLVVVGIAGAIAEPIISAAQPEGGANLVGPVMALRVFRLFRLARAVRLLVQFRTLWLLLQGLFSSAGTIVYTFCLLIIILYIFSCIAMEMITIPWSKTPAEENPEVKLLVDTFWPNLPTAMLSLIQFVFLDSIASIYTPMIQNDYKLLVFFIPFLMIVSVALMNLVTAVLVEGSLLQASTDKDEQLSAMLSVLKEAFVLLDTDYSGTLTLQEVKAVSEEAQEHLKRYLGGETLLELFEMLDADESGEVDIKTFCEGITRLTHSGKPIEFFRILNKISIVEDKMYTVEESLGSLLEALRQKILLS